MTLTTCTFVVTKVDYCSSVLLGISGQLLQWLQSVFNATARLVYLARKSEHITPLLCELHWLKVQARIQFRLFVLEYHLLNGTASSQLAETLQLTADVSSHRRLRSASMSYRPHDAPCWVIKPSWWLLFECGMLFCRPFVLHHRCCSSASTRRRRCPSQLTLQSSP